MEMTSDGKEPGTEPRIRPEPAGMPDETQPGFLEQVLGDIPAA